MDYAAALTWSWLNILTKRRYDMIVESFTTLDGALLHVNGEFLRELGCREETVAVALDRLKSFSVATYERALKERDVELLSIEDDRYPTLLREIGDPPIFLYFRGNLSILDQPTVALVGTRRMSGYGKRVVERFAPDFVHAGVTTVSGLAAGIDAAVARETLRASGRTVAVLGNGLGSIFPQGNARLAEEIVASGGLLLSEFPLDQVPGKYTFPARNRIIAGLSVSTVVLEAPEGSGALITSDLALDYGRDVYIVPGQIFDPTFAGSHRELAKGHGKLVTSARDVLEDLGIVAPSTDAVPFHPRTDDEASVYSALTTMPQDTDALVERSGLEAASLNATLTVMELGGIAKNVGGGQWVRA